MLLHPRNGFTLIELMIVVAIIGILAAVALPAAQGYAARSKMSEVVLFMSSCRTSVSEIYQAQTVGPGVNGWGCGENSVSSKYVQNLATDANGVISVTVSNVSADADGKIVTLVPLITASTAATTANMGQRLFGWNCGSTGTTVPPNMLPASCRGN